MSDNNPYLKLKNDFNVFWNSTLGPFLKAKEDLRKKYVARFWLIVLIALFVLPVLAIGIYVSNKYFAQNINAAFFYLICVGFVFVFQTPYRMYKRKIKNDVMPKFISFFGGFSYKQGQGLSAEEMEDSHVFPKADEYEADDCFEGSWKGVPLKISEEILKNVRYRKNKTEKYTVFRGIGVTFEMNKRFKGQTVVLKDSGFFNRFKGFKGFERVTLEDPVFEKIFEVYGTNQVEARFLLTPVFMEQVIKLKDLYKGKSIQLCFTDNKVLIAIDTKQDMFEPCSFFKTNLNKQKIDLVFEEFVTIFSIIDILKLARESIYQD